jgi:hypothetical protein
MIAKLTFQDSDRELLAPPDRAERSRVPDEQLAALVEGEPFETLKMGAAGFEPATSRV